MSRFLNQNPAFTLWERGSFGTQNAWNKTWNDYALKDPWFKEVIMCIELVFGGDRKINVACRPHKSISGSTDTMVSYLALLQEEPSISTEYNMGSGTASQRSFSMTLDSRLVDPASILKAGRMLAGWGEVSLQFPGIDYDHRFVIMRGDMSGGVRFASDRELLDFELVDPVNTQEYYIPTHAVTADSFSAAPDESIGFKYPFVLNTHPYVPAVCTYAGLTVRYYMATGGSRNTVLGSSVYVNGSAYGSGSAIFPWSSSIENDDQGATYLKITFGSGTGSWDDGDTVYVPVAHRGNKTHNIIEAIQYLIENHTLMGADGLNYALFGVSSSRIATCNPKLLINGGGSGDSATAFSYVESTLCGEYPMISMAWANGGYGPVVTDRRSGLHVDEWTANRYPLAGRATSVEETPKTEVLNVFSMKYGYNPMDDTYAGYVYRDASNSVLCLLSQENVGRREADVIEAVTVFDDGDATYIIDWLVAHNALPSYYVEYDASAMCSLKYQLGDNIKLTDKELGWDGVTATITKLEYDRARCTVGLRVWALYPDLPAGGESGAVYSTVASGGDSG